MTPKTRSGGAEPPASSVVYRSTPVLKQVQFPSRRKRVRTYGSRHQNLERVTEPSTTPSMKQQTLTQIEFVPSFNGDEDEDVVRLSDASGDENNTSKQGEGDKENRVPLRRQASAKSEQAHGDKGDGEAEGEARIPDTEDEGDGDDDGPTVRRRKRQVAFADTGKTKRRRTLGDEHRRNTMSERATRRRTLGDSPVAAKSRYHTQTLTQLIGRGSFIADSDEECLGDGQNDDGFLDWLGYNQEEEPSSPTAAVRAAAPATSPTKTKQAQPPRSREESVIPQTPVKSIRFQLPPSPQAASPSPAKIAKYGAPDKYTSPSKNTTHGSEAVLSEFPGRPQPKSPVAPQRTPSLVIQDSYASEGWASLGGTQPKCTPSQTQSQMYSTPAEAPAHAQKPFEPEPVQPQDAQTEVDVYHEATSQPQAEEQSQQEHDALAAPRQTQLPEEPRRQEIPDSDDEDEGFDDESQEHIDEASFAAGAETQLIMDQLQSSVQKWTRPQQAPLPSSSNPSPRPLHTSSPMPGSEATPQSAPPSSAKPPPPSRSVCHDIPTTPTLKGAPIRKPLYHPAEPTDTQGLPLESQRVPIAVLQAFPPATARTDILLPLSTATSNNLVSGHQDAITLPFKIPAQVVRFWLLTGPLLRYLCSTDEAAHQLPDGNWSYPITQVYELNNPVHEEDMRAEEWIHGQVSRYSYLPPAVVSQLLWNLRHALFDEEESSDSKMPSTPEKVMPSSSQIPSSSPLPVQPQFNRPPPSTMPAPPPPDRACGVRSNTVQPHVRPSQATTASQGSISTPPRSTQRSRRGQDKGLVLGGATMPDTTSAAAPVVGLHNSSSDSLVFDDHGGSSISMPYAVTGLDDDSSLASQLLTKSQMLPESLVQDEVRFPNEIGDSDDE